ncbi:NuoM family protein [Buchnera aphidicola]|uniref:NADH-quinone oxidoreductase subunit M n=1 Tax=Buchnera aphidicola (Sarucallis kahawaluokalani) TaxID=1241878 RepID=A0A4D6YJ66_9GAMM|nr:NADH-quinone oxidoreductase subunit M [Buchnera aphidicola]QCI25920.1 NADH-quinone oxidoreductase subunit M [Buchnera aphidicola (Sarucallis kahawaluokalani)]
MLIFFLIIPLLGSLCCLFLGNKFYHASRCFSLFTVILMLIFSTFCWYKYFYRYHTTLYIQYWNNEVIIPWIPQLGINLHFAIDGLSLIMIFLTSILGLLAILHSFSEDKKNENLFYLSLLLILFGTVGVLLSIDLFLFFCFWEIMLLPMYFLIIFWGHKKYTKQQRKYTANQFLIYTQISSILMLFSILLLSLNYYYQNNIWTFDYNIFIKNTIPLFLQYIIMVGFFIAFAVKMPIVPFHGWIVNCYSQSPIDSSLDLIGMLIKVAAYGLLRFNIHLFKNTLHHIYPIIVILGIITIFYSSWMAFAEKNVKKIIAYSSISHMGFLLITIYCDNYFSSIGSIMQIVFGSFTTAALFILLSQLYRRIQTNNISKMGGLYSQIKWIPGFFLFFLFANLNLPGTVNFIGEIMMLTGVYIKSSFIGGLLVFSLLFAVIYSLNMLNKIFYGEKKILVIGSKNMYYFEFFIILFFVLVTLFLGFYPKMIISMIQFATL